MPSTKFDASEPGGTFDRRDATVRRIPWLPLLLAAILVPLLLTALATLSGIGQRNRIQDDLAERSAQALTDAGIAGQVSLSGRDVTISGVPSGRRQTAEDVVSGVHGVRIAEVEGGSDVGDGGAQPEAPSSFGISLSDDVIALTGEIPDQATETALLDAARAKANGREVVDNLTIREGVVPGLDPAGVGVLIDSPGLSAEGIDVTFDGTAVTLAGAVATDADKAAIGQLAQDLAPNATVDNQLLVTRPGSPAFDKAALQQQINTLIAAQGITFRPDSADLTAQGAGTVERVAEVLRAAPEVKIEVDGHVAQTSGVNAAAQGLSELRAVAVRDRLAELGVIPDRMTALGFGASRPIAPNSTADGQAANRRVEIIVL